MNTVLVTYDPKNKMTKGLMDLLAMTKKVKIDDNANY